jgi:hypothetical protein
LVKGIAGKTILWRKRFPPRIIRTLRGTRYLVITLKGLRFAEKWYPVEHIPPHIARLYQLLLKLIRVRGVMAVSLAKRMGYGEKVIDQALSTGCVEIWGRPSSLPESVRDKILEMIGEAPREVYA